MFTGKNVLLVSHRPTALVQALAHSLAAQGAHITLALRHSQDGRYAVKRILKQLQPHTNAVAADDPVTSPRLDSGKQPLNMASLASIHAFAEDLNNSDVPLDLVFMDTWDLYAAGTKDRRWYTSQGLAGTAQVIHQHIIPWHDHPVVRLTDARRLDSCEVQGTRCAEGQPLPTD